ncbi:ASCH domain-containing protein [Paenibacillus antarcticus]|uniref:RNA-binding protein n=1 Tax=Paenibacillus antarcticus TaxID=253703 RepID=A0A168QKP8_9BACL|nr:ASCH domain-containing protein [Paenibacillus antarcticus]OAB47893.1 RNA-binding protein [Paenibacillus antarcticus]
MDNNSAKQLWERYVVLNPNVPNHYDAWKFGYTNELADELSNLVLLGTKTATASSYELYEIENEPLPFVGQYNIILDGDDIAKSIVVTTSVEVVPYDEVSAEHAFLEGEGDRSLEYWREVHEAFFTEGLQQMNLIFNSKMLVVCQRFQLVHRSDQL